MITKAQIQANKINSLKGGVKTLEGKSVTRFNAMKHGILGRLVTDYEKDFYTQIHDQLEQELSPTTIVEKLLIERLSVIYLRLFRLAKAENEYMEEQLNPTIYSYTTKDFASSMENPIDKKGYKAKLDSSAILKMHQLFNRYETDLENRFYRATKEYKEVSNWVCLEK